KPRLPLSAPSGRASVSAACDVVADVNHFVPYNRNCDPSRLATVDVADTSDPPVRSVIHCPAVQNCAGSRDVRCPKAARWRSSDDINSRQRAAPSLIANGHEYVADDG